MNLDHLAFAQKAIRETLDWCNYVRRSQGLDAVAELPKGQRRNGKECPCGKLTGTHVGVVDAGNSGKSYDNEGNRTIRFPLPEWVKVFVELFDNGLLPDYDSEFLKDNNVI